MGNMNEKTFILIIQNDLTLQVDEKESFYKKISCQTQTKKIKSNIKNHEIEILLTFPHIGVLILIF